MENTFKQKFENFEPEVPQKLFNQVLDAVEKQTQSSRPKSTNAVLWLAVSIVAFVAVIATIYWPTKTDVKHPVTENKTSITKEPINVPKTESLTTEDQARRKNEQKSIEIPTGNSSAKNNDKAIDLNQKLASSEQEEINNSVSLAEEISGVKFQIIGQRFVCDANKAELKLSKIVEGTWSSYPTVDFKTTKDNGIIAKVKNPCKVLFTYQTRTAQDTFTVFFVKSANLTYTLVNEDCGEENGSITFATKPNRQLKSENTYILNNNTIEHLIPNRFNFRFSDQYQCSYMLDVEMPEDNLDGTINTQAMEYRSGFPIYFDLSSSSKNFDCIWNFGDGEQQYGLTTEHVYKEPGEYKVQLQLIKANCNNTIEKLIVIEEAKPKLPNVFTPNNDGKNDVYQVSVPENAKTFEAFVMDLKGHLIYKWEDPKQGWDGRGLDGGDVPEGAYLVVLRGKDSTNHVFEYKSLIELIR
ncbi:MAG: gliding motility-associated C-terminal domain-containing protein [Bacteroidales bacterium]|nr:gliding motility-associated C-terminal domain-containing protein [Bacteroidales bacterium]